MKRHNLFKTFLAISSCKITRLALRLVHRGGTALPGRVALSFDKRILEVVSRGMEIIVVTGTNGKTTTCSMLRNALQESGIEPLSNVSGANLTSGITAEFASQATLTGKPKKKYAIVECDEAALKRVVPLIKPKVIVVTNLFRDQLDRYGEIMNTLKELRRGIRSVPKAMLCLNADCSLTASLAQGLPNPVYYYGISVPSPESETGAISDAKYCIKCGAEYEYDFHTYAHLGGFRCPKCGYKRISPDMEVSSIDKFSDKGTDIRISYHTPASENHPTEKKSEMLHIGLPALYNVYNAIAAIGAYDAAGWNKNDIIQSLANVNSSFGRMEKFTYNDTETQIILVKNPAGCNQIMSYLSSLKNDYVAVFCLNDKTADGHDISWIWDADYEKITQDPYCKQIFVSGTRANDMKVRLKYADAPDNDIILINDKNKLIKEATASQLPVYFLPNYTSMLELRSVLSAATGRREFWKDPKAR